MKPIENKTELVEDLAAGSKAPEQWRIGTEYEKFGFLMSDLTPLTYEGEPGIAVILQALCRDFGWLPVEEEGRVIALRSEAGAISLEPGGQLELSGVPLENLHQTCGEVHNHLHQIKSVAQPLGVGFLGMGFTPLWRRDEMHWMPKSRYRIMRRHMPRVGSLGLDMMLRTATVQVNLDFGDEQDMVKKFRVSLALQPLATALFANSPFTEGGLNGYQSYRSAVWRDTDPARCGMLPFVFEPRMGFERYVDYMLDVPMYFVRRDERYIDAAGQSFRDFLAGRLPALPGVLPTMADWQDHLTTAFPEVRLKRFLEMRGADAGSWNSLCALPAFWVGLLYDGPSLEAAWELVRSWDVATLERIRSQTPPLGLRTPTPAGPLQAVARDVLAIAEAGLKRRGRLNEAGEDETVYLRNLWEIVDSGKSPADRKIDCFKGAWQRSVRPAFREFSY